MASVAEIMQLCRLCLVKDQVNIPIFEEQGDIRQIFLKITACLPVKVSREDNLPKKICDGCLYKLELLYQFWNTTVNAEKQLLTWLNQAGVEVNVKTSAKGAQHSDETNQLILKQETVDPSETRADNVAESISLESQRYVMQQQQLPYESFGFAQSDFAEGQCTDIADATQIIANETLEEPTRKRKRRAAAIKALPIVREHSEDVDDVEPVPVAKMENDSDDDDDDDDDINDADDAAYAGLSNTDNEQPGPSGVGTSSVETPGETVIKEEKFYLECVKLDDLGNAKRKSGKDATPFPCSFPGCFRQFQTSRGLKKHYVVHADDRPFRCDVCDKNFKRSYELLTHKRTVHSDDRPFPCDKCDKAFKSKTSLNVHKRSHSFRHHKYFCDLCDARFLELKYFIVHKRMKHEGKNPYLCNICNNTFSNNTALRSHMIRHEEGYGTTRDFKCDKCEKTFFQMSHLVHHKKSRCKGDGRYQTYICHLCGKQLASSIGFRDHMNVHEGKKPFKCDECDRCFAKKETLKSHVRTHSGIRPHICSICGKSFTQRSPLVIHMRTHTGQKPYICDICKDRFVSKGALSIHQKSKHKVLK